ncbi:MAG: methyltransferase domain-containing protein [Chloroflexota bacterium]|nr:methyltransferase domain-containing protein [Chloroflexota bacterium]
MIPNRGTHDRNVRDQFTAQAVGFENHVRGPGMAHTVDWILQNLELKPDFSVLDVAAGTGIVARAVAPSVRKVVALDATPAMLEQGRAKAGIEGLTNVVFTEGDASRLPYGDGSFDLVVCRLAIHHFLEPTIQVREMARVCRRGGNVGLIDLTTSQSAEESLLHNQLERMRDPSHCRALSPDELRILLAGVGLELVCCSESSAEQDFEHWADLSEASAKARSVISDAFDRELSGGPATGMQPFRRDGKLMFSHAWCMLVGRK